MYTTARPQSLRLQAKQKVQFFFFFFRQEGNDDNS
jgi:hypothetical protein